MKVVVKGHETRVFISDEETGFGCLSYGERTLLKLLTTIVENNLKKLS